MKNKDLKLPYSEVRLEILMSKMPDILTTSGGKPSWNGSNSDDDGWT